MFNLLIVAALVALVKSHDVTVGSDVTGSNKIFDEDRFASPAIWKQTQNVTINATGKEVISKIVITDMRPEKDGEVKILEGGEGQNNVTLELKSPTALRGFAFHIEAYSAPKDKVKVTSTTPKVEEPLHPGQIRQRRDPEDHKVDEANPKAPVPIFKSPSTPNSDASLTHPITTDTKINNENKKVDTNPEQLRPARDVISGKTTETKTTNKPNTEESKIPKSETGTNIPRLTRDAAKETNVNADEHKNLHPADQTLPHSQPIPTFKHSSTESPYQLSTAKSIIEDNKEGKRAVRDAETDEEESDDSEQTKISEKNYDHDSHVPTTQSMENQPPREFKRQVSQPSENNNNFTKTTNNGAYVPPIGFANSESTNVKTRVARDTEDKKTKSPPSVISYDANSAPSTFNNEKQNSRGQSYSSNNGQRINGQSNTPIQRHSTPLPYAASSTTQKSQNKRDTESKLPGKEQQRPQQVNLNNTPRPYLRQNPKQAAKDNKQAPAFTPATSTH